MGKILRVSPWRAASLRMASCALSSVSLAGRLLVGVKDIEQEEQTSMLGGLPAHRRHAVRLGFFRPVITKTGMSASKQQYSQYCSID